MEKYHRRYLCILCCCVLPIWNCTIFAPLPFDALLCLHVQVPYRSEGWFSVSLTMTTHGWNSGDLVALCTAIWRPDMPVLTHEPRQILGGALFASKKWSSTFHFFEFREFQRSLHSAYFQKSLSNKFITATESQYSSNSSESKED